MGVRPVAAGRLHHPDPEAVCAEHLAPRPRLLGAGERHGPRHEQHRIDVRVERGDRGPLVVDRGLRADLHLAVAARRGLRPHAAEQPEQRADQSRQAERQPPRTARRTRMPPGPHATRRRRGARRHDAHGAFARARQGMLCPAGHVRRLSPAGGSLPTIPVSTGGAGGPTVRSAPRGRRPAPLGRGALGCPGSSPSRHLSANLASLYRRSHRPTSGSCAASAHSRPAPRGSRVVFARSAAGYGSQGGGAGRGRCHCPTG